VVVVATKKKLLAALKLFAYTFSIFFSLSPLSFYRPACLLASLFYGSDIFIRRRQSAGDTLSRC